MVDLIALIAVFKTNNNCFVRRKMDKPTILSIVFYTFKIFKGPKIEEM